MELISWGLHSSVGREQKNRRSRAVTANKCAKKV